MHLVSLRLYCTETGETCLECYSAWLIHLLNVEISKNMQLFKAVYSFGKRQISDMAASGKYGQLSNFITDVLVKNPSQQAHQKHSHCHSARFNSSTAKSVKPVIFLCKNASSFFNLDHEIR
jgi:6-phosphogluconolactonase (cycloisomerase 2 family)